MFELSPHIDKNKIFLVNLSEIEGRLDPHFYSPKFQKLISKFSDIKHSNLGALVSFSNETWNQEDFFDNEFPYIEISEIDITSGEIGNIKYVPKSKAPSRAKKIVRKNDIIISTTRPHRGAITLLNEKYDFHIASTGFSVIRNIKSQDITLPYLYFILRQNFTLLQMEQRSSGGNYPAITEDELKKILIPLPPKEIQQKIIDLYKNAYNEKLQKEAKAERLLNSIDDYLLGELGIEIPEKDNSLENRMFKVNFSEITGGRFDPKLYDNNTKNLKNAIKKSKFDKTPLKSLIIQSKSGDWGIDEKDDPNEDYIKCLVIRATEFDNIFNLNLDNSRVKYRYIHKYKYAKLDIQTNDLLIEKSGGSPDQPVGRIAIITEDILKNHTVAYSNFIHKIRINKNVVYPEFLFYYLKTLHNIKLTDAMQSQTNGIRNLIMNDFLNLPIALPKLQKQKEIAENIKSIKSKAKQLKTGAKEVLEQAKQEVEKMILN